MSPRPLVALLALAPLLVAFAPTGSRVQVGPDAPRLARTPAVQLGLGASAAARAFRATWGRQLVRWDERNGTPHTVIGAPIAADDVPAFVADVARLGGVDPATLVEAAPARSGDRVAWRWTQSFRGAPIEGGGVEAVAYRGGVTYTVARLHRPPADLAPRPGEVVLPVERGGRLAYVPVTRVTRGDDVLFVGRDGEVAHRWTERRHLDLTHEERTVGDAIVTDPAREVTVTDDTGGELTGDDGSHGRTSPYDVALEGPYLTVWQSSAVVTVEDVADDVLDADTDLVASATQVQHHFHVVRDWLEGLYPTHAWLPDNVPATVEIPGRCNAYYTGGTINFYAEGYGCASLGRIADVIYHEYGHGLHAYIVLAGTVAGDIGEGTGDFVSATLTGDPILAPNYDFNGGYIRELDTDRIYPTDTNGQVHNDGLIWGSMLWNLREQWVTTYGETDGRALVDALFLNTLAVGPTYGDVAEAMLAADDDNGDLSDGTPHACELKDLLDHHGLGPGDLGVVTLDHAPLGPQASETDGYPVQFSLWDITAGCDAFDPDSARVFYAVDPAEGATIDEIAWTEVVPARSGEAYEAVIPRQVAGARVVYWLQWATTDGSVVATSHGGDADALYTFHVGDREILWCDDFETGATTWTHGVGPPFDTNTPRPSWVDQWEVGAPLGQSFNPDAAVSGSSVLGTQVSGDGLYASNTMMHALTPEIDVSAADERLLLLSFSRWLTVEDARYDHARVLWYQDGVETELYENLGTAAGSTATLDTAWTHVDYDLRDALVTGTPVRVAFTLDSDQALEYGGWKLDDVCVVTLADVPGHYRPRDLVASDDADVVTITWTQPWIAPLHATALVRKSDGWPTSADDGVIVDLDLTPVPGEARSVRDPDVGPGETAYYALFAAPEAGAFYGDVVEGENADVGAVPAAVASGGTPPDYEPPAAPPAEEPREAAGCGCATGASPAGGVAGLVLIGAFTAWSARTTRATRSRRPAPGRRG